MRKPTSTSARLDGSATRQSSREPRPKSIRANGSARRASSPRPAGAPRATCHRPNGIPCADCEHCRTYREAAHDCNGGYLLKVRCAKLHWRKGKDQYEATYHLHTVLRRVVPACPDYASLSDDDHDRARYLDALAADLPVERIVYSADGSPHPVEEVS